MFIPFTRIMTVLMAAVICFAVLIPLALQRHNTTLAITLGVVYVLYLGANVLLWQRMKPRS